MATEKNFDQLVITYLNKYKIVTIGEMKTTLNTQSRMTVFRRLSKLQRFRGKIKHNSFIFRELT
jgi:hypothetical protein